jgi:uncharacterized protein
MELLVVAALAAAGFVAAFLDSIVGGGGVISLPALIAAGLDPHMALGTNKLAATGASSMATIRYTAAGVVVLPLVLLLIPLSVVGSFLGANTILQLDPGLVKSLVLLVMAAMTVYVLVRRTFGRENRFEGLRTGPVLLSAALALAIGFYDGFLGPGTGSFLLFAFVGVQRFDFVRAAGHARVLNFASNLSALALFALRGHVDYAVGLPMMGAMLAGAYVGSHVGLRHGARWIKPLFLGTTLLLMAYLFLRR